MPRAFSEPEKKRIGERLLEQGYKHFATFGLKKTNIEELAAAAGISKGAFYLFYESKESLFMDVVERVEADYRRQVLEVVDLPGPSPRARLFAVLKKAFTLWKTVPILQIFTRSDLDLLSRRVPPEQIQEHVASDSKFIAELIMRCQKAGIPIQAPADQVVGLLYATLFASLHENDLGAGSVTGSLDVLLELIAAFCLGEIVIQSQNPNVPISLPG